MAPSFSHATRPDPRLLIQCDQLYTYQRTVDGPRGSSVCYPLQSIPPLAANLLLPYQISGASVVGSLNPPPPSPAPVDRCLATSVTMYYVMSTGMISGGWSVYVSRLAADRVHTSGCLVRRTSITLSPVFLHSSSGCSNLPLSRSVIHRTAIHSFPQSDRL